MPWGSSTIIGLFVGAGLLAAVFGYLQVRLGDRATIPIRILKQRSILTGGGVLFFTGAACYVVSGPYHKTSLGLFLTSMQDVFYIPFWFQSVQGLDALTAGIRMIAFALPQIIALVAAGAIVTRTGHYVCYLSIRTRIFLITDEGKVPLIILGELICITGTVLLTRLRPDTSTVSWAAFLVVTSVGMGMAMQLPYTAVQVVLRYEHNVHASNVN